MSTAGPRLVDIAAEAVASNIRSLAANTSSLDLVPGELLLSIFDLVLAKGRLSPRVLALFTSTGDELVLERVAMLRLQDVPPLVGDGDRWLGDAPSLF